MKEDEVLRKVIEKAVNNGYKGSLLGDYSNEELIEFFTNDYEKPDIYTIIFSIDFAKAFWGKGELDQNINWGLYIDGVKYDRTAWKYHLQKLVILSDEEKIKYLEKFL